MGHTTQPCCRVTYGLIILFRSLAEFNSTREISLLEGGGGQIPTLWDVPRRREKEGVRNVIVLGPFKFWVFQTERHYIWNLGLGRMRLLIGSQGFPESSGDKCNRGYQVVTRQDGKGGLSTTWTHVPSKNKGLKRRCSEARENRDEVV